jgi:very-short-patch-repair endonuclease
VGPMKDTKPSRTSLAARQAAFAKAMRLNMIEPERTLWKALRWRIPLTGTHFRRQVPLGPYIADFCSHGAKVVVEMTGTSMGLTALASGMLSARHLCRRKDIACSGFRIAR